jgi:ribosomal protein S9
MMSEETEQSAAVEEGSAPSHLPASAEPSSAATEAVAPPAEAAEPQEPPHDLSEEARAPARRVRDVLQDWAGRITATGGAGRGATMAARMATARALADLRHVQLPDLADIAPVRDYLHHATSAVSQAARDIERNRYSLHEMHHQLERLAGMEKRILPEEKAGEAGEGAESQQAPDSAEPPQN